MPAPTSNPTAAPNSAAPARSSADASGATAVAIAAPPSINAPLLRAAMERRPNTQRFFCTCRGENIVIAFFIILVLAGIFSMGIVAHVISNGSSNNGNGTEPINGTDIDPMNVSLPDLRF